MVDMLIRTIAPAHNQADDRQKRRRPTIRPRRKVPRPGHDTGLPDPRTVQEGVVVTLCGKPGDTKRSESNQRMPYPGGPAKG